MQLEISGAHMQVTVSAAKMWLTIFLAMMQVVFSAVHYAHDYFYCNYVVMQASLSFIPI